MKGRLDYQLTVEPADAAAVAAWIEQQYADLARYEDPLEPNVGPTVGVEDDGSTVVFGSVRFETPGDEQAVLSRIEQSWTRNNAPFRSILAGSRTGVHTCTHDEPRPVSCTTTWSVK